MAEQGSIIDLNSKYQSANTLSINTLSRALVYGDCVFEHIRTNASKMLFFGRHIEKLINAMQFMNMAIPKRFSTERQVLKEELTKLLVKNKIFKGGLLTLIAFRTDGAMQQSETEYIAFTSPMPEVLFSFNTQGISLGIYSDIPVPQGHIANFNTHAVSIVCNLATQFARQNRTSDALLVNNEGNIVGAAQYGNIFCVKDQVLYTPPFSQGCVDSVIRRHVLDIAAALNIKTDDNAVITADFLKVVDEIFFVSIRHGITWAGALQNRRFYRRTAEMIHQKLNEYYADEF